MLLVLLLASIAVQSFDMEAGVGGTLSDVFRTVLGFAILVVVFDRPRERAFMAVLLVVAIGIGWARRFSSQDLAHPVSLVLHTLMSIYLWAAVVVILRDIFRGASSGVESLLGAVCGYLLAGNAWGAVDAIAYLMVPTALSLSPEVSALVLDWQGRIALFSYYGYAQMLTLGYSDVTPVRAPATTLSLLGSLFGLFYTAVVVSQFVGLAQSKRGESS